jgi:hypothetical protein
MMRAYIKTRAAYSTSQAHQPLRIYAGCEEETANECKRAFHQAWKIL